MKLSKFKMPSGKKPEPEMDMSALESEAADEGEPMDQEMSEESSEPASELEAVSDEDLIAEFKKRGLKLDQLEEGESSPPDEEEQYI